MTNPTSNYGWQMPTPTDLVTDLPADFEVFGQVVDTSLAQLKGGTTGQVLSKTSGTDMAFTWASDATGMANPMTTTGDVIYSSSGSTPARLGIGTALQELRTNAGATAPEWFTPATSKIVQIVNVQTEAVATGTTTIPNDDTIPQNNEGDQYMSLAITPNSATNILTILVTILFSSSAAGNQRTAALFQDTTANALAAGAALLSADWNDYLSFSYRMVSGTTSATTFKLRAGGGDPGTTTFNGRVGGRLFGTTIKSTMTITESTP